MSQSQACERLRIAPRCLRSWHVSQRAQLATSAGVSIPTNRPPGSTATNSLLFRSPRNGIVSPLRILTASSAVSWMRGRYPTAPQRRLESCVPGVGLKVSGRNGVLDPKDADGGPHQPGHDRGGIQRLGQIAAKRADVRAAATLHVENQSLDIRRLRPGCGGFPRAFRPTPAARPAHS